MDTKSARLTVLIDPARKAAFERVCAAQDVTPSQVVRRLVREFVEQHGGTAAPAKKAPARKVPAKKAAAKKAPAKRAAARR